MRKFGLCHAPHGVKTKGRMWNILDSGVGNLECGGWAAAKRLSSSEFGSLHDVRLFSVATASFGLPLCSCATPKLYCRFLLAGIAAEARVRIATASAVRPLLRRHALYCDTPTSLCTNACALCWKCLIATSH